MSEMEPVVSIVPLLAVAVAAAAGLMVLALGRQPNLREGCSLLAGAVQFILVMSMAPVVWAGGVVKYQVVELLTLWSCQILKLFYKCFYLILRKE